MIAHPLASDIDPAGGTLSFVSGSVEPVPNGGQPANALQVNGGELIFTGPIGSYSYFYQVVSSVSHNSTIGYVRFNIQQSPISVVPMAVNVPVGGSATIDLLADASDSSGSVLAVTSVEAVGSVPSGLFTELSGNKQFEVTASSGRPGQVADYTYTVSDGESAPVKSQIYVVLTSPPLNTMQATENNAYCRSWKRGHPARAHQCVVVARSAPQCFPQRHRHTGPGLRVDRRDHRALPSRHLSPESW